jgi:hypothetical protein
LKSIQEIGIPAKDCSTKTKEEIIWTEAIFLDYALISFPSKGA